MVHVQQANVAPAVLISIEYKQRSLQQLLIALKTNRGRIMVDLHLLLNWQHQLLSAQHLVGVQ